MPKTKRYTFFDKLMEAAAAFFADQTDDMMLDVLADQETRICMLELGIND